MRIIALIIVSLFFPASASATVYINEVHSYQSAGDWVELYADLEADISGWYLKDEAGNTKTIDAGTKIGTPSASLYLVNFSNRLNKDGDLVELYNPSNSQLPVNSMSYGVDGTICAPGDGESVGRRLDGSPTWTRFHLSTPGTPNTGDENTCPTPSPSPSPSPSLSPSPNPSPSPSPSRPPSPTPKPSPSVLRPSPALSPEPEGTVAGATSEIDLSAFGLSSPTPSPSPIASKLTLNQARAKQTLFIGSGLVVLSVSSFFGYRQYRRQHL